MECIEIEIKKQDSFLAAVYDNGILYYSSWTNNGLFAMDLKTGISRLLNVFEEKVSHGLHIAASLINNEIWFFPAKADKIAKFSLKTNMITYVMECNCFTKIFKFASALEAEDKIVLIPKGHNALVEIDKNTGTIREIRNWLDKSRINNKNSCNFNCGALVNDWIYLFPSEGSYICKVNMGDADIHVFDCNLSADDAVILEGNIYFLANNKLYRFSEDKNSAYETVSFDKYKGKYKRMFVFERKIWLIPYVGDLIVAYEPNMGRAETIHLIFESDDDKTLALYGKIECDDFIIVTSSFGNCQHLLIRKNGIKAVSCTIDELSILEYLLNEIKCVKNKKIEYESIGKKIYEYLSPIIK